MRLRPLAAPATERLFNGLVVAFVATGFVALVVAALSAVHAVHDSQRRTFWVQHTYQVERAIFDYRVLQERLETTRRGFLLENLPLFQQRFAETGLALMPALDRIGQLTADNPRQQANVAFLRGLVPEHRRRLERSVELARHDRAAAAVAFARDDSFQLLQAIRHRLKAMTQEEDRLLAVRLADQAASAHRFTLILMASAILVVAVGIASIWVILRYTHDLATSRAALRTLNDDLEGAVRERTRDLQRANDEIQRFAYIVSHDLRSPLVNVMGFTAELEQATKSLGTLVDRAEAEVPALVSGDARTAAREDLPEAIGFIRSSTQKMDRLINAILRLSREGRRPITPERIDMDMLARGVADSLRHRADELGAEISVAPHLPPITSDRLAVEQILSNIAENALKYLKPGVPGRIAIEGRRDGERTIFTVTDNGRGIEPRDHERIFDLFRRSGAQDQPGEGIGLAHTRALAYRLGGTIAVDSTLGQGASFRVSLPLVYGGEQGSST